MEENQLVYISNVMTCIFNALFAVPAIVGNILVVLAIWKTHLARSPSNILLSTLAFADLQVGLIVQTLFVCHKMAEIFKRLWVREHPRLALRIPSGERGDSFATMLFDGILILIANDDFERWILSWLERIQHHSKGQSEDAPPSAGVSLSSAMTTSASILV